MSMEMDVDTMERTDPIDQLVPPPRPWPVRLLIGTVVVALVGCASVLVGFGYVYPQPECCGSGGGSPFLAPAGDGESVVLITSFFNSSGRTLLIEGVDVTLPGARVLDVRFARDPQAARFWPVATTGLPATIGGTSSERIVIRFVPDACGESRAAVDDRWGDAVLHLEVDNGWLPSIDRDWALPGGLVDLTRGDLGVLPPDGYPTGSTSGDPLIEACALLAAN